jgi:uncharacterized protein YcbK (DUF882 family)
MTRLTKHVWRREVACKCGCGFDAADVELVRTVEECVTYFEQTLAERKLTVVFNSWCRCARHNKDEGGATNSQHLLGRAVDFYIIGVHPERVANWLDKTFPRSHGIGRYNSFTHLDRRPERVRWDNRREELQNE